MPDGWRPIKGGIIKYPVRNQAVRRYLRQLLPGKWRKVILLNLGILESLSSGLVSATDALRIFFNAENCLFVRQHLRDAVADEIMSHGTQLPDLFEVLPAADAQREFQRELATIRSLCLSLLEEKRLAT